MKEFLSLRHDTINGTHSAVCLLLIIIITIIIPFKTLQLVLYFKDPIIVHRQTESM